MDDSCDAGMDPEDGAGSRGQGKVLGEPREDLLKSVSYLPVIERIDNSKLPSGPWTTSICQFRIKEHGRRRPVAVKSKNVEFLVPFFLSLAELEAAEKDEVDSTTPIGFLRPQVLAAMAISGLDVVWVALLANGETSYLNSRTDLKAVAAIAFGESYDAPPSDSEDTQEAFSAVQSFQNRCHAMQSLLDVWRSRGRFPEALESRSDLRDVFGRIDPKRPTASNRVFVLERDALKLFAFAAIGVHLTGYIEGAPRQVWIGKRSKSKRLYPGLLDSVVAGGMDAGDNPWSCIVREADEEASLDPKELRRRLVLVSMVKYTERGKDGWFVPSLLYCFDAAFPDPGPRPQDNDLSFFQPRVRVTDANSPATHREVAEFKLRHWQHMSPSRMLGLWKINSAVCQIDYALRHGLLTPKKEPYFVELSARIRSPLAVTVPVYCGNSGPARGKAPRPSKPGSGGIAAPSSKGTVTSELVHARQYAPYERHC